MVIQKRRSGQFYALCNKKGSAHFEIIISFVLFVSFTLFLVLSLEPTKQDLLEESILYGVVDRFFVNATTNVTSVLVFRDEKDNNGNSCPNGADSPCVPDEIAGAGKNIYVREKACVYYIYSSEEFIDKGIGNCKSNDKKYSLGYIERQQVISNKTLQTFKEEYSRDYNASKTRFGVPEVVDFAVIIVGADFNMTRTIPDESEVISGVYRKKVIYGNGSIINQDFIVKVW